MKVLVLLAILASATALTEIDAQQQFVEFAKTFGKKYEVSEVFRRLSIFKDNVEYINRENAKNNTYTLGVNEFSDLSHDEFLAMYVSGLKQVEMPKLEEAVETVTGPVPDDIDWRSRNAVTGVKNQGNCGSCWAFSTTGAVEGAMAVAGKGLPNLSEQQLVDCAGSQGNHGCQGGWPASAMTWISRNGGICAGSSYPYRGVDQRCSTGCAKVATCRGGTKCGASDSGLVAGINMKPVSVAIDAGGRPFQSYRSGVFSGPCTTQLNHAVLAVGYTGNAYIVKNSWGTSWGNGGYIWMARGNTCGIVSQAYYASV